MDKEVLYRFFQGNATLAEEIRIKKWLEIAPENHREFLNERKLFDAMLLLADEKRISSYNKKFIWNQSWMREIIKIAAVVAITLTTVFVSRQYLEKKELLFTHTVSVPAGQRVSMQLSDGTLVWLNSKTNIQYPEAFSKNERRIKLDGEAYFEVAHDRSRPFVVETAQGNVEVLGTKFNLEAYSNKASFVTSLMEGSVKVRNLVEEVILNPNQMAYMENGKLLSRSIDNYNPYRWREGLICFKDAGFAEIMERFETCFGVEIKIENQALEKECYTGKFRQEDGVQYALNVLQKDMKFILERGENSHIIYIK